MTAFRRFTRTAGLSIVLSAVTGACGGTGQPADSSSTDAAPGTGAPGIGAADSARHAAVPATCADLHETILAVPPTRQAFSAEFGAPDSIHTATEPNRHVPGATDSLFTVYYNGLVMDIRTPQNGRDMATHVRVEDDRYLAYPGIGMGTTRDRLEEVLGNPTRTAADAVTWDCSTAVEQPVTFHLAGERVRAITIAYYVD